MVRTGARAAVLRDALHAAGLESAPPPERPRLADAPQPVQDEVMDVYRRLGGLLSEPTFRPGAWDLSFAGGLVVELDEELHFNRFRATTLAASWAVDLPWTADYRQFCAECEPECLSAGAWGRRWTNDSCARMFSGGEAGDLTGDGAPRWKQRALHDSLKDTVAVVPSGVRLARLSTHDVIDGAPLGAALEGLTAPSPDALRALVEARAA